MNAFSGNHYEFRTKLFSLINTGFFIHDASGAVILYGRKKGFKLKEDIRFFADAEHTREVLTIAARSVLDISANYDVTDSQTRQRVGVLRRKGLKSILRDEWHVLDVNEQLIATIQEDSPLMALLRRFLSNLIPQSYNVTAGGAEIGEIKQNFNPFLLKLKIDVSADARGLVDRRLVLAAAALLGTVEGRQR